MRTPASCREDFLLAEKQIYPLIASPDVIPVTCRLDGTLYRGLPKDSRLSVSEHPTYKRMVYEAQIGNARLCADCRQYVHFGAVEWTLTLTNTGNEPLAVSDFLCADLILCGSDHRILTSNGDFYSPDGYKTDETVLRIGDRLINEPSGGRPCDSAFPYQRVLFDGYGFNLAIGWPGQWRSVYERTGDGIRFTAGQSELDAMVEPGETIRTPLMAIVGFDGDLSRGINVWRRWYYENVLPHPNGQPVKPHIMGHYKPDVSQEFSGADEENQLAGLRRLKEQNIPVDVWWLDAGWYDVSLPDGTINWFKAAGNWVPDSKRFPHGLAPVGELCRELGISFLLWHEPERVGPNCPALKDHPEWLLRPDEEPCDYDHVGFLNMGDPECRQYVTDTIARSIRDAKVAIYRQDYNMAPLSSWRHHDEKQKESNGKKRTGMTENLYVQGYLAFWDALLAEFPDMLIDSCASGGRRNDLETMRRAVPMHHTDSSYGNHPVQQSFFTTLYSWIPYFRSFCASAETEDGSYTRPSPNLSLVNSYQQYGYIAPMITLGRILHHPEKYTEEQMDGLRRFCEDYRRVSPLLIEGDFYPLTPYHKSRAAWTCFQFDRPEEGKGMIQVIRNNAAPEDELKTAPAVTMEGVYEFSCPQTGERFTITSEALRAKGLTFRQEIRSAFIWEYKLILEPNRV